MEVGCLADEAAAYSPATTQASSGKASTTWPCAHLIQATSNFSMLAPCCMDKNHCESTRGTVCRCGLHTQATLIFLDAREAPLLLDAEACYAFTGTCTTANAVHCYRRPDTRFVLRQSCPPASKPSTEGLTLASCSVKVAPQLRSPPTGSQSALRSMCSHVRSGDQKQARAAQCRRLFCHPRCGSIQHKVSL